MAGARAGQRKGAKQQPARGSRPALAEGQRGSTSNHQRRRSQKADRTEARVRHGQFVAEPQPPHREHRRGHPGNRAPSQAEHILIVDSLTNCGRHMALLLLRSL